MLREATLYALSGLLVSSALVGTPADFGKEHREPSGRSAVTTAAVAYNSGKPDVIRPRTSRDNRKPGDEDIN
ncbi:Hypothetical protein RG1141_PA02470 (plasmid) [Neorhizobium galegae bv. officinalis bv. officinalis str. HAMBI 1141]|uniref:Uncharacterized protein n=1 Tax=Neorhizobium galegae bv. officinalis bv. officinalis str. HAMBI 1141 TaxID=1028801 RepID=A0A068TF17_NEOGA|nr:hypothetical protein [Neorhizobium galegae]CDN57082.1 Hypothetical protein RG1141_PA02470 [Neorhizobium galegae bv. officinalis bv. officinalis str. HAMBI 1141]